MSPGNGRGVPNPGLSICRPRLERLIEAAGDRAVMLVGPSGCGKTVLASQWAARFRGRVVWRSLQGAPVAVERILSWLLDGASNALSDASSLLDAVDYARGVLLESRSDDTLLVLDDVGIGESQEQLDGILMVSESLRGAGVHVVLTTQSIDGSSRLLREAVIIGRESLLMTLEETELLVGLAAGRRRSAGDSQDLMDACGGHPALMSVLLKSGEIPSSEHDVEHWVHHIVREHIGPKARRALAVAALLRQGTGRDLDALGVEGAKEDLMEAARVLPLVRTAEAGPTFSFSVHDLAAAALVSELNLMPVGARSQLIRSVLKVLSERDDWAGCMRALQSLADEELVADWLANHGLSCVSSLLSLQVNSLIDRLPMQMVMARPDLLLLWSKSLSASGDIPGSLARARAASVLLSHEQDRSRWLVAVAAVVDGTRDLGRNEESLEAAREALPHCVAENGPPAVDVLRALAATLLVSGDDASAVSVLARAMNTLDASSPEGALTRTRLQSLEAVGRIVAHGDFASAARMLSGTVKSPGSSLLVRATARGNLGVALTEIGRTQRAEPLLRRSADVRDSSLAPYYMAPLGVLRAARGRDDGLSLIEEGVRLAIRLGDESEAAVSRVYQSVVLRADESLEESLISAERAYEELAQRDYMGFRRLAALEVAASLLALGDVSAARNWAEPVAADGFGSNLHHALRAAMILAECDRRDGDVAAGVSRLAPFAEHVASENSNWQAAMYIRAFPELLGMFALAFGVKALPSHMIRMVLPQHAERSLRRSKPFMKPAVWEALGLRVLGKEQFKQLVDRKGQPICHVRLFGGLEVSVDGRAVQERDWKKRKARLLFAMLAIRRGADIARDELLDHLWPDLDEERGKNNFYVAWSAMKVALLGSAKRSEAVPYVESSRGRCRIVREAVRMDIDDFDEAIAAAREAEAAGRPMEAVSSYERLSATYRGDVLPGDVYDDWFSPMRDNYRMQFIDAMVRATELLLEADDPCEAQLYVRRGLSVDPLREDLYQLALRCHIIAGQRSAAIDTFLQCRTNLGDELGLDPSSETMKLYQEVLSMEECPRADHYGLN